ncbi:MAG: hypothetical protein HY908_22645 [Myxococcales bacterium]|nr:hypothetical protein [Myxococcales bacterium]
MRSGTIPFGVALCALLACSDDQETAGTGGTGGTTSSSTTSSSGGTGGSGGDATPFGCVGSVSWPTASVSSLQVAGNLSLVPGATPLSGITVRACAKGDAVCTTPLDETVTATDGRYSLTLPIAAVGFDGYLEVTGGSLIGDLVHYLPPLVSDVNDHSFGEINLTTYDAYLSQAGLTRDPARAQVAVTVLDCHRQPGNEIALAVDTADGSTVLGYDLGGALDTAATATGVSGFAVFVNLPVGPATITASIAATGEPVAEYVVTTRANFVSSLFLPPTPGTLP